MATGRVIRFDDMRGYGFIAPDDGGEDVFVHANTMGDEKYALAPGVPVEFEVCESDRGLKALSVRVITRSVGSSAPAYPAMGTAQAAPVSSGEDDGLCDVLPASTLAGELTEELLDSEPTLTGAQIKQVRKIMVDLARKHGWVEN